MIDKTFLGLVQNAALLLAMAFIFDVAAIRWRTSQSPFRQALVGLILGAIGIIIMLTPWTFGPGIVFDTRSVLLGISGLFFGSFSAAIAMAMTAAFRYYLGGTGVWTGIAVIIASGVIGIAWRHFCRRSLADISWRELYFFGMVIHLAMLGLMLTLPWATALPVLSNIALPVILIYPLGTALLGMLMVKRLRRERMEEELQASKTQLSNALEMAHLGHWEYDVANDLFTFNDQFYNIFRTTVEKVGGYTMHSAEYAHRFVHPDDIDVVGEETRKAIETMDPHFNRQIEHRMLYADGTVGYITVRFFIVKDSHGRTVKTYGVNQDITERKRAEEELLQEQLLMKTLLDSLPGIFYLYSYPDLRLIRWNNNHETLLGFGPGEIKDRPILEWHIPEAKDAVLEAVEVVMEKGQNTIESPLLTKDGRPISFVMTGVKLEVSGQTYLMGVGIDITERKRAEEEKRHLEVRLQRAEKMEALGQLAGGIAHDLNNVLGILSGYSELLLMEIPEGNRSRGHVEKILQSTEKGAAIIQDLLTLARRGVTASDVINLNSVVSGFLKTPVFEKMKDYHPRVTFLTGYDKNLLNIKGSPVHLEKTLMNLVSNAAEAISGKGEVTIRTESRYLDKAIRGYDEVKEGDYAVLTVSDTGMGIPAENIIKIFEPFYTKKTMGRSGTGLGLAIVWGTVKDHNGYIDVQTKVGQGTTFTLYFPVTREELIAPQQKEPIEQYMGKGESVLVVDDIAEQRDVASGLLTRLGYEVHLVSSGEEAVEYLRGNKADILVLDMIMAPGIDGLETYQRVLEINPKQKAIIVSGFSETERVKEAQKLGVGAYVKKPYVMEKIGVAIRDELSRK